MLKRIAILAVVVFVVAVFGLFAFNFYRRAVATDEPERPPVIFQRADTPSRA